MVECQRFLQETQKYVGTDRSQNMINLASSVFDCNFINCEASNLPFDNGEFDYVVAYSIFQYFPSYMYARKAITEMNRVSKNGCYIGDLPTDSHEKNHLLYNPEQFEGWEISEGIYTNKRFDVWKTKDE